MHRPLFPTVGIVPQLLFHIQEPDCNGYDFHYHLKNTREFLIGRSDPAPLSCSGLRIALQDCRVSRDHCRIFLQAKGGWMIEDLNSTNGTFFQPMQELPVEWQQVITPVLLPERAFIRIGLTLLSIRPFPAASITRQTWQTLTREVA